MEGKFFFIRSELNELVLDVKDSVCLDGNPVVTWDYHGGDNQLWYEDPVNGCIRSKLDEEFVLEARGDEIVVAPFNPDEYNQRWQVGGDRINHRDNNNLVFDIAASEMDSGARICSWDFHGGPNQLFSFTYLPTQYFMIRSFIHDNRFIDIEGESSDAGTKVVTWKRKDSGDQSNQIWYEDKYGYVHSQLNDMVMDTSEGSARMQDLDATIPGRTWVKVGKRFINKSDPGLCLEVRGGDTGKGTKIDAAPYKGAAEQHWEYVYV